MSIEISNHCTTVQAGSVITQAVSRWLPTAAARVRALSGHMGFVVDKEALGQVFSEYFCFPCQSSFHQILHPHNHPGQVQLVADVPSGPSWVQPPTIIIKKINYCSGMVDTCKL
jgi:hypothetical protein